MPLQIVRHDITKMSVDAIVNAANSALKMGGGVCGAIFQASGADKLQAECDRLGSCPVGEAVITKGYNLPARFVIHTVGPVWHEGSHDEAQLLHNCYINSLALAEKHKLKSIAFPLISSGIYGYPKDQSLKIAVSAISEFLSDHDMMVYLVVYDKKAFALSEQLFNAIEKYIDDHYIEERMASESARMLESYELQQIYEPDQTLELKNSCPPANVLPMHAPIKEKRSLTDVVGHLDESFSQMLLRLIDEKNLTDVETYKRANIDRKLFSKIRGGKSYNPSKATAIALAIALHLNLDETLDLLGKAGYTLSHSNKFDVIIEYFIEEGNFNIFEINQALFAFDQIPLGG